MSIIETVRTKCRDCYKCVRACPVKAIKVERGRGAYELHASVMPEFCINDGTCLRECPQGAKRARQDTPAVKTLLARGEKVIASLAPSFVSCLPYANPLGVVSALRRLGFAFVQETSLGAEIVSAAHRELLHARRPLISSACPATVSLVEKYHPEAIPFLAPLVSPAVAHGRYLKKRFPGAYVVFIGPCVAKKAEIEDPEVAGAVDVAITFQELAAWFREAGIDPDNCEQGSFDGPVPSRARLFAADGGLLKTVNAGELLSMECVAVSGIDNCQEMIRHFLDGTAPPLLVELLACPGGCISGPGAAVPWDLYERRARLIKYQKDCTSSSDRSYTGLLLPDELERGYSGKRATLKKPGEDEIAAVLEKTGKFLPEDELNCGACGYSSCRDKAVAVFNGMADPEMCIPYMRRRAESMANLVVTTSPNGVVVTSRGGTIVDMNQVAERILGAGLTYCAGLPVDQFMPAGLFHEAAKTQGVSRGELTVRGFTVAMQVVYVPDHKLLVGFLADITEERAEERRRQTVASESISRAQQVIENQMAVVQKIAGLLGETVAETKITLTELMKVVGEEKPSYNGRNDRPKG